MIKMVATTATKARITTRANANSVPKTAVAELLTVMAELEAHFKA